MNTRFAVRLTGLIMAFSLAAGSVFAEKISFSFLSATIELPDSTEAAGIISKGDEYTKALSPFDLQARLQTTHKVTEQQYLSYASKQVRTWTPAEVSDLKAVFGKVEAFLKTNGIALKLPAQVQVIKSMCEEEFGAEGYTRRNFIVLNPNHERMGAGLAAHELFHVYSRYNKATRDKLYQLIEFVPCEPIAYKHLVKYGAITNPDCPVIEHYTTIDGKDYVVIIYNTKPYKGGNVLQESIGIGLIELQGTGKKKAPKMQAGLITIVPLEMMPQILENTGGNTPYILHPEEVCAEHFAMMIGSAKVAKPEYIEKMKAVLQGAN